MINPKNRCPACGHVIDKREIALFSGLVEALWRVFKWCEEKQRHEFSRKEIEHLIPGGSEKARFGDLILFGGLVYKNKKARYGLNMERCDEFFSGLMSIPTRIWKDQVTGETDKTDYRFVHEIPSVMHFLNEDLMYEAKYKKGSKVEGINKLKLTGQLF